MVEGESRSRSLANLLVAALFVAATVAPIIDWWFAIDKTPDLIENRTPAPLPAWPGDKASIMKFPKDMNAYWNDHFGFRRLLVRSNAFAEYEFGISSSTNVVVGKHDYLFYTGGGEQEAHRGLTPFSEAELVRWTSELEARRDWLARRGAKFVFVIAPDKESVYPEMLPDRFKATGKSPADQLVRYMAEHSRVDVLDLRPAMVAAKAKGRAYWRTDTHWSDYGERAAYQAVIGRLQQWYPGLNARPDSDFRLEMSRPWSGDLAVMLGFKELLSEEHPELDPRPYASREVSTGGYLPPNSWRLVEFSGRSATLPRAVFFHDSFLLAPEQRNDRADALMPHDSALKLIPLFAEEFSFSAFNYQLTFEPDLVQRVNPDVVVEEVAERFLKGGPQGATLRQ